MTMKVRVKVTKSAIEQSMRKNSSHCMVAEAIKEALPQATHVSVDVATIRFSEPKKNKRSTYLTPRMVQKAIIDFDSGKRSEPFNFTLSRPAQIRKIYRVSEEEKAAKKRKRRIVKVKDRHRMKLPSHQRAIPVMGLRREFGLKSFVK